MEKYTDLAVECYESADKTVIDGVKITEVGDVTTVSVLNEKGAEAIGKDVGRYLTFSVKSIAQGSDLFDGRIDTLSSLLASLIPDKASSALVVGLGNTLITADALGPAVNKYVLATRHIVDDNALFSDFFRVSAINTGVLGNTGIESAEIISGIVKTIEPSFVIVVDALAACSADRLGTTVQLSDTGISPGSGVGNHRNEISQKTLGVPVISIGIPTVVSSSLFGESTEESMFVTPREIDRIIEHGSRLIGMSINTCLQKHLSAQELFSLVG